MKTEDNPDDRPKRGKKNTMTMSNGPSLGPIDAAKEAYRRWKDPNKEK